MMRIVEVRECSLAIHRHPEPTKLSGDLTTSIVEVVTDAVADGMPIVGRGFSSVGRYAQGGLIRERFAPRLMNAAADELCRADGSLDPVLAWKVMMRGEKPGGHGDRSVAVGTLDMALWDAAAKMAVVPAWRFIAEAFGTACVDRVPVYASGGYLYPDDDLRGVNAEFSRFRDLGFTRAKMKIGATSLDEDLRRIEAAANALGGADLLAVDSMNSLDRAGAMAAADELNRFNLWWWEDVCDPLDFETQASVAGSYPGPLGAGEALFSLSEARLLHRYGGLRADHDVLLFDPVHCYGLPGYVGIVRELLGRGWSAASFYPHAGHLFGLHVAAALGLGGAEINPFAFAPFSILGSGCSIEQGMVKAPRSVGIGFEEHKPVHAAFRSAFGR